MTTPQVTPQRGVPPSPGAFLGPISVLPERRATTEVSRPGCPLTSLSRLTRRDMRREAQSFDTLFDETLLRLESSIAFIVLVGAGFVFLLAVLALATGSSMPRAIPLVPLAYFSWYLGIHFLFQPWMRYACLFAGVTSATQFLAIMLLVVRPATPVEVVLSAARDVYVSLMKAFFLLTIGGIGWVATGSMRGLLRRLTESAVERERVRGLLGMHVSEQVMEYLLSGKMKDGGERRTITVCFTDIRDFTPLSESHTPEEVLRLLNLYFGRMCDIVAEHGEVVNKFLGDGMLIVFGAPANQPDDAQRAPPFATARQPYPRAGKRILRPGSKRAK